MKTRFALLLLALTAAFAADAPVKVKLVSKDGKIIEAEVVSVGEKSAKIKKADGTEYEIPFDRLKPESVATLKKPAPAAAPAPPAPAAAAENDRPLPKGRPAKPEDIPERVRVNQGEKLFITFTQVASGLTKPVFVDDEPEVTMPHLTVEFPERKEGDKITSAKVTSFYGRKLTVKCLARNKGQTRFYATSILPLTKGMFSGESWSADVEELVFYDFAWVEAGKPE